MATINPHTTRASGTVLTAAIYNADHVNHVNNCNALNAELLAQSVTLEKFGAVGNGTVDDLAAITAAINSFSYGYLGSVNQSGGKIMLTPGKTYYVSGSINMTGKHGLFFEGPSDYSAGIKTNGDYPAFIDTGSAIAPTVHIGLRNLFIANRANVSTGGRALTNGHGIKWKYTNSGMIDNVFGIGCNHAFDLEHCWQVKFFHNRTDGATYTSPNADNCNIGLYMRESSNFPTEPIDNAVIAHGNIFQNCVQYPFRLINAQGSKFTSCEGGGGINGWYIGDPSTGTALCQWVHFSNCLADSVSGHGWLIKRGAATVLSQMAFSNCWSGNAGDDGVRIENASELTGENWLIETCDNGIYLLNCDKMRMSGNIGAYNVAGSCGAVILDGTTDSIINTKSHTNNNTGVLGVKELNSAAGNMIGGKNDKGIVLFGANSFAMDYGLFAFRNGDAANPGIVGAGINAGMYWPAASEVAFAAGGTGQFRVTSAGIVPVTANTPDIGTAATYWRRAFLANTGLRLKDTNASHDLIVSPGSDITADRTLTLTTGDADKTLDLAGASWTPGIAFGGGSTGVTYNTRSGNYQRIGNMIIASWYLELTNKGSSTGNATVTGLPVSSNGSAYNFGAMCNCLLSANASTIPADVIPQVGQSSSVISLKTQGATGSGDLTNANFNNTTVIMGTVIYFV